MCLHRGSVPQGAAHGTKRWNADFVHDQFFGGKPFNHFEWSPEVDQFRHQLRSFSRGFRSPAATWVVAALDLAIEQGGTPISITLGQSTEFTRPKALEECVSARCEARLDPLPTEAGTVGNFELIRFYDRFAPIIYWNGIPFLQHSCQEGDGICMHSGGKHVSAKPMLSAKPMPKVREPLRCCFFRMLPTIAFWP